MNGLKAVIVNFDKEHPDEEPSAPEVLPDKTLKNYHGILSVRVVLHPEGAREFLICLATTCQSKLALVPQQGTTVTAHFFRVDLCTS